MSILARHPVITFGLGLAAGFLVHKYRKEIIQTASDLSEKGKDFVLEQKENLADILAETQESGGVSPGDA